MKNYKHILLAVDFFEQSQVVTAKAKSMAEINQAKLSLIHVVENLPIPDSGYGWDASFEVDLTSELFASAKKKLAELGASLGVSEEGVRVELGSPKYEITRIAEENQVDLIVVGSHGRHGLALILGSTANGVLHHAKCDVLAVRLQGD